MNSHKFMYGVLLALALDGCSAHNLMSSAYGGLGQSNALGDDASPNVTVTFAEYTLPDTDSHPNGITRGQDGNVWFTEILGNNIGRITSGGSITEFPIRTPNSFPSDITEGSDGNLWFTESLSNKIGRITPQGAITEFTIPTVGSDPGCVGLFVENTTAIYGPIDITLGPDGAVWFGDCVTNSIGRITPAGHFSNYPLTHISSVPLGITTGTDKHIYFDEWGSRAGGVDAVGKMTKSGGLVFQIPTPTVDSAPINIASGLDDKLLFTEPSANQIGEITYGGSISETLIPSSNGAPNAITFGPDGAFWFCYQGAPGTAAIYRVTNAIAFSQFLTPYNAGRMRKIVSGPDANLWFSNTDDNAIGVAQPSSGAGRWRMLAPMPIARAGPAVGVINGLLYVVGGFNGTTFLSTNQAYNPAANSWSTIASMPTAREVDGANAPIFNGKLFVLGGNANGTCSKKVEAYDPTANTWATLAPMPTARCHFSAVLDDGLIYAIGGTKTSGMVLSSVDVYSPTTNTWSAGNPLPKARAYMTAATLGSDILVYEGSTSTGSLDTTMEDYNATTQQWLLRAGPPTLRSGAGGASGIKNRIYAIGGTYDSNQLSVIDAFDSSKNYWFPRASMPTARTDPGVGTLSGHVYVIGGSTANAVSNANEEFIDR